MRHARARNKKHAFEIRIDEFIPVRVARVFEWDGRGIHACAVEDVVDSAKLLQRRVYETRDLGGGPDVHGLCVRWGGGGGGEGVEGRGVDVAEGDGGAEGGEFECCGASGGGLALLRVGFVWVGEVWSVPDTACAACDEDDFVLEGFGHCCGCVEGSSDQGG